MQIQLKGACVWRVAWNLEKLTFFWTSWREVGNHCECLVTIVWQAGSVTQSSTRSFYQLFSTEEEKPLTVRITGPKRRTLYDEYSTFIYSAANNHDPINPMCDPDESASPIPMLCLLPVSMVLVSAPCVSTCNMLASSSHLHKSPGKSQRKPWVTSTLAATSNFLAYGFAGKLMGNFTKIQRLRELC